jgi:hypothetical protein
LHSESIQIKKLKQSCHSHCKNSWCKQTFSFGLSLFLFRYNKTVKVYHWGSYQDSVTPRPDLFPLALPQEIGLVSGDQNLVNSLNGILSLYIISYEYAEHSSTEEDDSLTFKLQSLKRSILSFFRSFSVLLAFVHRSFTVRSVFVQRSITVHKAFTVHNSHYHSELQWERTYCYRERIKKNVYVKVKEK